MRKVDLLGLYENQHISLEHRDKKWNTSLSVVLDDGHSDYDDGIIFQIKNETQFLAIRGVFQRIYEKTKNEN